MRRVLKQLLYGLLFLSLLATPIALSVFFRSSGMARLPIPPAEPSPLVLGSTRLVVPSPLRPVALLPVSNTSPTSAYRAVLSLTLFDTFGIRLAEVETRVRLAPLEERPAAFFNLALDPRDVSRIVPSILAIEAIPSLPRVTSSPGELAVASEELVAFSGSVVNDSPETVPNLSVLILLTGEDRETISVSRVPIGSLAPSERRSYEGFFRRSALPPLGTISPAVFVEL